MKKTGRVTSLKAGLSKFCFAVALCMCLSIGTSYAQRLSLEYRNVPIRTVLKAIEDQTDYSFVYSSSSVNVEKAVSIRTANTDITTTLNTLFKDQGIVYQISENQIILSPATQQRTSAQTRTGITGVVKDANGEFLIGATVIIDSGEKYAITNGVGEFQINGSIDPKSTLSVSYLGYRTSSLQIGNRSHFEVVLEADAMAIDNVLVTGYQSLPAERATGAFGSVATELLSRPTTNVGSSLIGTVTGMQVTADTKGKLKLQVRGQTTLGESNRDPLVVVDGFEIEGGLETLNPNDIENITILKDAASASIWGARAANGVLVIVTRGGKFARQAQPTKVEFSAFMKYSPKIDLDYLRPLASSAETIEYEKLVFNKYDPWYTDDGFGPGSYLTPHSPTTTALNEYRLGFISESELNAVLNEYSGYDNSDQIRKYLLQNPFTQQYNVNISGATERMSNNLSLLYESNAYQKKGEDMWRMQASYRTNIAIAKWLDFNFTGTYSYNKDTDNSTGSGMASGGYEYSITSLQRYRMLLDENGEMTNISPWYMPNLERHVNTERFPYDFWGNPIDELSARDLHRITATARAQAGLTFKIIPGLNFVLSGQYELTNNLLRRYYSENSISVKKVINEGSTYDRTARTVTPNHPLGGFLDQNRSQIDRWDVRAQVNFNRTFNDVHDVAVIAGAEAREKVTQIFNNPRAFGYNPAKMTSSPFPNGPGSGSDASKQIKNWVGNNLTLAYINSFGYRTDRFISMYGNASYTYKGKYTLTGSVRNDASNLITDDPAYRYSPFWSVGGSWQAGHEDFMNSVTWVNRLTVRLTYGYNGNVDTSTSFMPLLNMSSSANIYTNGMTASIGSYGNPTLRWERTGTWNFGIDYALFGNKLFGKLDVYNKNTTDMIASVSIPSINGTTSQKINNAEMTNRGFEIEVGTRQNLYGKDVTWYGSVNASYNRNKITKLFVSSYYAYGPVYSNEKVEGYDANSLWVYTYNGLVNIGTESHPDWQPSIQSGYNENTGQYDYFTFGTWPTGDAFDISTHAGTRNAPWNIGLVNSFKIYDFDFSFILSGKFGHKFLRKGFNYPQMTGGNVYPNKYLDEVMNGDPDKIVPLPLDENETRLYFWDRFYPYLHYMVEDAGHIRMREINVTYNLPQNVLSKIGIDRLQVYAQANNVFNIYFNKYNQDPEFPLGSVKPTASFTFGFKATF